jgi:hypothetical protein
MMRLSESMYACRSTITSPRRESNQVKRKPPREAHDRSRRLRESRVEPVWVHSQTPYDNAGCENFSVITGCTLYSSSERLEEAQVW